MHKKGVSTQINILRNREATKEDRETAINLLGSHDDSQTTNQLIKILQGENETRSVRSAVVDALRIHNNSKAISALIEILNRPGDIIWYAAKQALEKLDTAEAKQALQAYCLPTILKIRNSDMPMDMIQRLLNRSGYEVVTAWTCEEVLKQATMIHPNLIILDLPLFYGDQSELDYVRELKTNKSTNNIPLIILSADSDLKKDVMGLCDAFILKPIKITPFLKKTRMLVESKNGSESN